MADESIAARLISLRTHFGFSRREAAGRMGICHSHLGDLEAGRQKNPRLDLPHAISKLYGVSVGQILGEPSPEHEFRRGFDAGYESGVVAGRRIYGGGS